MKPVFRSLLIGIAAILAIAGAQAAGSHAPARPISGNSPAKAADSGASCPSLIDVAAGLQRARDVTLQKFPDADDVVVDARTRVEYQPDGRSTETTDYLGKILTEKGRRDASTFGLTFNETYGGAEILAIELYKAGGAETQRVDLASQARVMIDASDMGSNIYDPHQKILQAGIPRVEIGDILRIVFRKTTTKTRVPDQYFDIVTLEGSSPILHECYEIAAPKARPLKWKKIRNEIPGTITYEERDLGDAVLHRWEVRDVPRLFPEPGMPDLWTVVQRVIVSTADSWEELSRWYWKLCEPRLNTVTPDLRAKVAELTAGRAAPMEKIDALFGFVSQQIRYMGIMAEAEAPGYEPHDVRLTFENRYGVCRDKAALLAAMLQTAGIESFPVIIKAGTRIDDEVPIPMFNHAITAARVDGRYVLMDPTDESTRELLPSFLDNCSYLVATPQGEKLLVSPVTPAEKNLLVIDTDGRIDTNRTLVATSTLRFQGINDNAYRGAFARRTPREQRQFFESALQTLVFGARMTAFRLEPADMQDRSTPLTATLSYEAPDAVISGGTVAMVNLPWLSRGVGVVNHMMANTALDRRRYPLVSDMTAGTRETLTIRTGGMVGPALTPKTSESLQSSNVVHHREIRVEKDVIHEKSEMMLTTVEVSPQDYPALKSDLQKIEYARQHRPLFRPSSSGPGAMDPERVPGADVAILDTTWECEIADAHSWTLSQQVRKKILTYGGLKDQSELKVPFNPLWASAEVRGVRVISPDGKIHELTDKEVNVMDADWVASAPRYPASRILVVSFPGVSVGSVIEYTLVQKFTRRPFVHLAAVFGGFDPIGRMTVRVRAPETLALTIEDPSDGRIIRRHETRDGWTTREWRAEGLAPLPREPDQTPVWAQAPSVFVSSGDWSDYARTVKSALERVAKNQPHAAREGRKVARDGRTAADQIQLIRNFVDQRIRRTGPELTEVPLDTLTPADRTLEDGYGSGPDLAAVLYAMLEGAGFKPSLTLVGNLPSRISIQRPLLQSPQPNLFGEVLVRVEDDRGNAVYLNDTDQYAVLGSTPSEGCDALALDRGALTSVVVADGLGQCIESEYDIRLDEQGRARIGVTLKFRGAAHNAFVRQYTEMPPEERRRFHEEQAAALSRNARLTGPVRAMPDAYPATLAFEVEDPRFAVRDGARLYFRLPGVRDNLLQLKSGQRTTPWFANPLRRERALFTVRGPDTLREVEMSPLDDHWMSQAGQIRFHTERPADRDAILRIRRDLQLEPAVFEPAEYPYLREVNRRLSSDRNALVVLKVSETAPEKTEP